MILRIQFFTLLITIIGLPISVLSFGKNSSIAIIGAGIAGLSAARRLEQLGYNDVTVFEASSRIGGRVYPVPFEDGNLQLGAQFINGNKNPIYKLADELGLIGELLDDEAFLDWEAIRTGECELSDAEIALFRNFAMSLEDKYEEMAASASNRSIGELYLIDYEKFIRDNALFDKKDRFNALTRFYRSYYEVEFAADWNHLALLNWVKWNDYSNQRDSYTMNRIGYAGILDYLIRPLNAAKKIFTNSKAIKITYGAEKKSKIDLENGETHSSDYVIVTVPLGHLKRHARRLFSPALPRKKLEAIDKLGFGHMSKVILVYNESFWHRNDSQFLVPLSMETCYTSPIAPFLHIIQPLEWHPNVLIVWLSGDAPTVVDQMEDDDIAEQFTEHLRAMLQRRDLPKPIGIVRTRWSQDDLFLGSYSYISVAAASLPDSAYARMASPVYVDGRLRLLFAGEATHDRIYQTVIGAFLSGRREADRIATFEKK